MKDVVHPALAWKLILSGRLVCNALLSFKGISSIHSSNTSSAACCKSNLETGKARCLKPVKMSLNPGPIRQLAKVHRGHYVPDENEGAAELDESVRRTPSPTV